MVNADYYGRQGLGIIKKRDTITMSNLGGFRIEIDAAKSGGVFDPRNGTMLKMFNLIDIGERASSSISPTTPKRRLPLSLNISGWSHPVQGII